MIAIKTLQKKYKDKIAIDIPALTIAKGESFGLVGNNGAGKTTLFRMLLDLIKPSRGRISSKGADVSSNEDWKNYTGSYLDTNFLIGFLTPEEYFYFIGELHGFNKTEVDERLAPYMLVFNDEVLGQKKYIRDLSMGNQKKVGIVAAMFTDPEVLILDEPFANLDPSTQIRLKKQINAFREEKGATVLISSHDLSHVTDVCRRIVVLEQGKIVHDLATDKDTLQTLESYFMEQE